MGDVTVHAGGVNAWEGIRGRQDTGSEPRFWFDNSTLRDPSSHFRRERHTGEAVFSFPLGVSRGSIPIRHVAANFGIAPDSKDAASLRLAEKALRYRTTVKHGDPVPSEILDGRPSFVVSRQSVDAARRRLGETLWERASAEGKTEAAAVEWLRSSVRRVEQALASAEASQRKWKGLTEAHAELASSIPPWRSHLAEMSKLLTACDMAVRLVAQGSQEALAMAREHRDRLRWRLDPWADLTEEWESTPDPQGARFSWLARESLKVVARSIPDVC